MFAIEKISSDTKVQELITLNDFSSAADHLFHSQLSNWELMRKNYKALEKVQLKSFWFDGFKLKVQYNPERIKSTSAEVDENSVANRKCFLCSENLPAEQKGILLDDNYVLLCNPYPIIEKHFTVASVSHQPQRISDCFSDFLKISKLLSPGYTIIYNGPACGASAPDHLHFQAVTKQFIPVEDDIQQMKNDFGKVLIENEITTTSSINDGLRKIILIESKDILSIEKTFRRIFREYESLSSSNSEPMMNLICSYDSEFGWTIIIFLRRKHRPECFYEDEPERLLISPAAIDLGGLVVTPRENDFIRTDKELLEKIFNEVSLDEKTFYLLQEKVKSILD